MKMLALALLLLGYFASPAQKNEMSVLNNRFYLVFPDSAKNMARGGDIMGPNPNENSETRIIYDESDKRMVFFARDLYIKTTVNLAGELRRDSTDTSPFMVKSIYDKDSVTVVKLTPQKFDKTKKAILINSLFVQNPDSTLCRIDAYINPAAFADKDRFQQMSEQVFSTFREGSRRLNLAAHTDTFVVMGTKTTIQIKLPQDYIVTKDRGEDFEVYRIKRVPGFDEKESSSITVYYGFYPSAFSKEYDLTNFRKPDTDEDLMFHTLSWENYYDPSRNLSLREGLFDDDEIEKGMKMQVAILSNNKDRIEELSGIVKNLLVVYDPAHVK